MTDEKSVLIEFFGDPPLIRVLDFLAENRGFDYSKTEISRGAGISWGSLYGLWDKIDRLGIVIPTRSFGTRKIRIANFCARKTAKQFLGPICFQQIRAQSATLSLIRETKLYKLNEKNP